MRRTSSQLDERPWHPGSVRRQKRWRCAVDSLERTCDWILKKCRNSRVLLAPSQLRIRSFPPLAETRHPLRRYEGLLPFPVGGATCGNVSIAACAVDKGDHILLKSLLKKLLPRRTHVEILVEDSLRDKAWSSVIATACSVLETDAKAARFWGFQVLICQVSGTALEVRHSPSLNGPRFHEFEHCHTSTRLLIGIRILGTHMAGTNRRHQSRN